MMFMIRAAAEYLTDWCIRVGNKNGDRDIIAYGLECRITDIAQTAALVIMALLMGRPVQVLLFCLCFTSLKQSMGGYHAPNHFLCISGFTALAAGGSLLPDLIPPDMFLPVVACCVLLTLGTSLVVKPKAHQNHPKSEYAGRKSRKRAVCIAIVQAVSLVGLSILLPHQSQFWLAGAFGGSAAALTLIISKCGGRGRT